MIKRKILLFIIISFITNYLAAADTTLDISISDNSNKAIIESNIASAPALSKLPVTVTAKNGTVFLAGTVETSDQAAALIILAYSLRSVNLVSTNNLFIKNVPINLDLFERAALIGLMIRNQIFTVNDFVSGKVMLTVRSNQVTLSGIARTQSQIEAAKKIASEFIQIKGVNSLMQVQN